MPPTLWCYGTALAMVGSPLPTTSWRRRSPQPRGGPEPQETHCTRPLNTESRTLWRAPWEPWSVVRSSGTSTKAKVSRLEKGREYIVRVRAENKIGIGAGLESPPTVAKHMFNPPGPPGLPDKSYADICWTKPTRDGGSPILGYVVEAQKTGTAQWDRINKDLIKMCAYRVPGLIEGMEYKIRIRATNKVGDSEPRELPQTILAKDILVPPEVVVDVACRDSLTVRAGQIISLITRVKGRPDPEITWTKDARALSRDKRTEINNNYPLCELVINEAVRSDYGKYAIVAKNSSGQAQATIIVNVLDTPGACQNIKVAYVTKNSCMVSWENPEDNGGTEITQYIIECRQPSQRGWTVVSNDCTKRLIKAPLTEGCEYFFRVSAENKIGAGPPTETKTPVLIKLDGTLVVKAGDSIPIEATVKGKPQPDVKWTKDESTEEIRKGPRLQIETGADFSKLPIQSSGCAPVRQPVCPDHQRCVKD
uniref:Titin n=1 Tax=Seriola dumerili TaxID=41447 RepID=A0A3B4THN9_SERDU